MGLGGSKEIADDADSNNNSSSSSLTTTRTTPLKSLTPLKSQQQTTPKSRVSITNNSTPSSASSSLKRKHEEISKPNNRASRVSQSSEVVVDSSSTSSSAKKVKRDSTSSSAAAVPTQALANNSTNGIDSSSSSQVVITFSGFKNSSDRFSKTLKKELAQIASSIGVTIAGEQATDIDTLSDGVTHVIAPPFARTMKVLQALATGKRIMSTKWITDAKCSLEEEDKYGVQRLDKPLKGKNVYLAESFIASNDTSSLTFKHCHLLVGFGEGNIIDNIEDTDFCIIGSALDDSEDALNKVQEEKDRIVQDYPDLIVFEWAEFVDLIYPYYLEQALRKMEK